MVNQTNDSHADLIGAALDVSAEPAQFDDLLDVASAYILERAASAPLPKPEVDSRLEARSLQIARLLEQDLSNRRVAPPQPFHARLEIDLQTLQVSGNQAAKELTQCQFPCALDDLPLDYDTRRFVR